MNVAGKRLLILGAGRGQADFIKRRGKWESEP